MSFSQVNQIKASILAKEVSIARVKAASARDMQHYGYQMAQFEQEIYELNIKLQLAEADEAFYANEHAAAEDEQDQDDPCYHCGRAIHSCICVNFVEEDAEVATPAAATARSEGTKLKWISSSDPQTYRIAIVKKNGVLEVKNVKEGLALCHDYTTCNCTPCSEIALSFRLGAPMPPWLRGRPLTKTFFETEAAWSAGRLPIHDATIPVAGFRLVEAGAEAGEGADFALVPRDGAAGARTWRFRGETSADVTTWLRVLRTSCPDVAPA
jgi:hypothetical protein